MILLRLVLTALKINFTKNKPKEIIYRYYKNFNSFLFNDDIRNVLDLDKTNSYAMFEKLILKVLDKHAPIKKTIVRANHAKDISKPLRKAIVKRSYLGKVCFKIILKSRQLSHWKDIGNKKTISVDCIKRERKLL